MYLYESHMGGIYFRERRQGYNELYCPTCHDTDTELGKADTFEEAWNLIKEDVSVFNSGGWSLQYTVGQLLVQFDPENSTMLEDFLYGEADLSDIDILKVVEKYLPNPIHVYKYSTKDDEWYLLVDTLEEAQNRVLDGENDGTVEEINWKEMK